MFFIVGKRCQGQKTVTCVRNLWKGVSCKGKPTCTPPNSHSPESWEFCCETCGKTCMAKEKLITHIRTHTNEKPFQCPHCSGVYAHRHNLRIHINSKHADIAQDLAGASGEGRKLPKKRTTTNQQGSQQIKKRRRAHATSSSSDFSEDGDSILNTVTK